MKAGDSQALVDLHIYTFNKTMDFEVCFTRFVLLHETDHVLLRQTVSIGPENGLNKR